MPGPERALAKEVAASPVLESLRDGAAFARARREWAALHDASTAGPFCAWEWLYPWYRRLGEGRELMILTARNGGGQLEGLMPLSLSTLSVAGRRVRVLSFLGDEWVGSDYLDVIARSGTEGTLARDFAFAIRAAQGQWDVLDLHDLEESSPTVASLREAFAHPRFQVRVSGRYVCPYEPFTPGEPFEEFLRHTARRDNYLRRRKWLERQPGYRIEVAAEPAGLALPMAEFFRLHAARWSAEGGSQGIRGARVEAFHRDATAYLAERGRLRLFTMRLGGRAVASVYGIVQAGKFLYYQSGYDPALRDRSVGLVLVGETFHDALSTGLTEYDFLHGTEPYKSDWVRRQRRTVSVRVTDLAGPGPWLTRSEEAGATMRGLAKRLLPEAVVDRVRRRRRARAP